jgi:hypothetical protein
LGGLEIKRQLLGILKADGQGPEVDDVTVLEPLFSHLLAVHERAVFAAQVVDDHGVEAFLDARVLA